MSLERVNYAPPLARALVTAGVFAAQPLRLLDVGCSGGIEAFWRAFEPALVAAGFDPLIEECQRLNAAEKNPRVRYHPRWVRWPGYASLVPAEMRDAVGTPGMLGNNQSYQRSSSSRSVGLTAFDANRHFSQGAPQVTLTDVETSIDAFLAAEGWPEADFIKVDTDGGDYEVLLSAQESIAKRGILGMTVEVQFHGVPHDHANTFANIDRFLRGQGYSLYDLDVYRYSRAALPDRFTYDIPAQTPRGQVGFGEALYLRDVCLPGCEARRAAMTTAKLAKLVLLYEVFGLADCAAELLLAERERFSELFDVEGALDLLAATWWPRAQHYRDVAAAFEADPRAFLRTGSAFSEGRAGGSAPWPAAQLGPALPPGAPTLRGLAADAATLSRRYFGRADHYLRSKRGRRR